LECWGWDIEMTESRGNAREDLHYSTAPDPVTRFPLANRTEAHKFLVPYAKTDIETQNKESGSQALQDNGDWQSVAGPGEPAPLAAIQKREAQTPSR
jgi:hypothetical protein